MKRCPICGAPLKDAFSHSPNCHAVCDRKEDTSGLARSFAAITGSGGRSLIVRVLGLIQLFFAVCSCVYVQAPSFKHGTFYQPLNLAFGACGVYCLFTGKFPFLTKIGMTVAGRRLESKTYLLGFLNLIITVITFVGMFVYMAWVEAQGARH
jgi:hypothetical protein